MICECSEGFFFSLNFSKARYDIDHALVLAQMHHFKAGILYLYEKAKLWVFSLDLFTLRLKLYLH